MDIAVIFTIFIYSLRTFTSLFWGVLLCSYHRRSQQSALLGVIFILIGILYLRNGFFRLPVVELVDVYNPLSYLVLIFIAPFTIFYAYFALGEKHNLKHYLLHFIPFVVTACLWLALHLSNVPHIPFCLSLTDLLSYTSEYPLYVLLFMFMMTTFVAQVFTYFSIAFVKLMHVWRVYREHNVPVRPLKMLFAMDFLFLIYPLVCVVFMSYNNALHFGLFFNILVSVVITTLSILNIKLILPLKTDLSFMDRPATVAPSVPLPVENKDLPQTNGNGELIKRVKEIFELREIYRLPHIRLQDIADELGSNRSYISACINSYYGCSFSQLLILYRINTAKKLLLNTSMSVQEIIEYVGFNTRASFYRAFKENIDEELSPNEWRKLNKKDFATPLMILNEEVNADIPGN